MTCLLFSTFFAWGLVKVYQHQILLSSPVAHTIFLFVTGKPFWVATAGLWIIAVAYEAIAAHVYILYWVVPHVELVAQLPSFLLFLWV